MAGREKDGWTDGRVDGQTDGQMEGQLDKLMPSNHVMDVSSKFRIHEPAVQ